jgi:imidazolonepropionase-like amidohydrolase
MRVRFLFCLTLSLAGGAAHSDILAPPATPGPEVVPFVKYAMPRFALTHVRVIDGTGAPVQEDRTVVDRTVVVENGRISAVTDRAPDGVVPFDLAGRTLMPGIVGMHDHLFYIARPNLDAAGHSEPPLVVPQMTFSAPRLYLAAGVTTLRTTGSVEPYADLNIKRRIDTGAMAGPHLDVTGPYLEGEKSPFIEMHLLKDEEDAKKTVAFWADQGATSFKAYMNITRAELKAAIGEAHRRGLKLTGHLCSVTYPEAAELGIDDLEHGFFVNTQLDPGKVPDQCPDSVGTPTLQAMDAGGQAAADLIALLVRRHVALTSTLPVFEQRVPEHAPLSAAAMAVLTPEAREAYLYARNLGMSMPRKTVEERLAAFKNAMALEKRFVEAGGLLLAGPDPTGNGGVIPGFGDLREIELLAEAGFSPEQAIRIATLNGAVYLGLESRIGSVAAGKNADLVVVNGDPSKKISDIEKVEIVFKDGIGYDPQALLASVRGRYGQY